MSNMIPAGEARQRAYGFVVLPEPNGDGYSIVFPDLPGVSSWAATVDDVAHQVREALAVTFEEAEMTGWLVPAPGPYPDDDTVSWRKPQQPERDPAGPLVTTSELAERWGVSRTQLNAKARRLGLGRMLGVQRVFTADEIDLVRPRQARGRPRKQEVAPAPSR